VLLTMTRVRCQADRSTITILPGEAGPDARDGPYVVDFFGDRGLTLEFDGGQVKRVDGRVLRRVLENVEPTVIDPKLAAALRRRMPVGMDFVQTPLRDAVQYLEDQHGVQIAIDPRLSRTRLNVSMRLRGAEFGTALWLFADRYGLACDYRYGVLWITTPDDVPWEDPTGVNLIVPPAGSDLEAAWNQPLSEGADFVLTPLRDALQYLQDQHQVTFDGSLLPGATRGKGLRVTLNRRGVTLQNVVGELLYRTGCTCKLDGETIVILPPETR